MAGRGSPAKSAGSARPKFFFLYFRNLRVKLCGNPSVRGPGPQLDFGRPGRPASPYLGIFPAVSGRSYRLAGPAGHINLGRQVSGRVRPEVGPGRPIVARPEDGKLCGRRRPEVAGTGRCRPALAGGGRGWPMIAFGILLVCRAHRDCQSGNRLVRWGIESIFQFLMVLTWLLRHLKHCEFTVRICGPLNIAAWRLRRGDWQARFGS